MMRVTGGMVSKFVYWLDALQNWPIHEERSLVMIASQISRKRMHLPPSSNSRCNILILNLMGLQEWKKVIRMGQGEHEIVAGAGDGRLLTTTVGA
nr:hypothetical protein Iba_chr14aCG22870 [Ipomoea batatas]